MSKQEGQKSKSVGKNPLEVAADKYVSNSPNVEIRRMYGHYFQAFIAGAEWQKSYTPTPEKQLQEAHTPGKAYLSETFPTDYGSDYEGYETSVNIETKDGYRLSISTSFGRTKEESRANAGLIVKCLNEYDSFKWHIELWEKRYSELTDKWSKSDQQVEKLKSENEKLKEDKKLLLEALKPLADLDTTGVTGEIVYVRNKTQITMSDILTAKLLTK